MRITLGLDFDHGSWPGPLGDRRATAGESWVGPAGLLDRLETLLGLGGPPEPELLRAAALVPQLLATEGFWSRSAEHNPLAAARTLLGWRDDLRLRGWRGEGPTERLAALARVTAEARPGHPDRLDGISREGGAALGEIRSVRLVEPRDDWPPLWRDLFSALERAGCRVEVMTDEAAGGAGTLGRARRALLAGEAPGSVPADDGELQLVRPHGPSEAAEEIATWLAALADPGRVVLVGGEPLLDRALRRHGLPTSGSPATDDHGAMLQILPLALALGWDPPDPQRALELLTLPVSPIRWEVRKGLADALAEWPAVGSPRWTEALAGGLAQIEDEDARRTTAERLETLLRPAVPRRQGYPVDEVARRTEAVRQWAAARRATDEAGGVPWDDTLVQCRTLLALVDAAGLATLTAPQLERFVAQASRAVGATRAFPAEAGMGRVGRPGGIFGPADRVIWWSFDLAAAQRVPALPLSRETREALGALGIELPDPGRQAVGLAARWRRPLLRAERSLLLVCPRTGVSGEALYPHPLWDEITGSLGDDSVAGTLVRDRVHSAAERPRQVAPARPLPEPRRDWTADPDRLGPREIESLSGLTDFLGCSLRWALRYHARLRPGRSNQTSAESALLGSLLHEIVETALLEQPSSPQAAAERARELFDELAPKLAAPLYLPGADSARARARHLAPEATRRLAELLAADGRRVDDAERWLVRDSSIGQLGGRLDLVVGDPPAIVDLKLGSGGYHRKSLQSGTSGLAVYSYLLSEPGASLPPIAYFILAEGLLLSTDGGYFSAADQVDGPGPEETFRAWERAGAAQREAVEAGQLEAPGNPDETGLVHPEETTIADGRVVQEPPCRWCDFELLCGRFFSGDDS